MIQTAPDEKGASAKIHDAAGEAFVHGHIRFAGERIIRMKTVAVATDAAFVAEGGSYSLAERDAAIFNRVMRVHFQIAVAAQIQIHGGVLRKEREHVIKKRHAGSDLGFAFAIKIEADRNPGFFGVTFETGLACFHARIKTEMRA